MLFHVCTWAVLWCLHAVLAGQLGLTLLWLAVGTTCHHAGRAGGGLLGGQGTKLLPGIESDDYTDQEHEGEQALRH